MKITLLFDTPDSWIVPYAQDLERELGARGHDVVVINDALALSHGDIAFFLSCEKIVPPVLLRRHTHNLVIHESALPQGKGFSPLTWQILEGKRVIPVTLFEAAEGVDSGPIFAQETLSFEGHELVDELRSAQGEATLKLALQFIDEYPNVVGKKQEGKESVYPRRRPKDSELDPNKPLAELFDQLRVADNERYPAFFTYRDRTYVLKIYKK